MSEVKVRLDTEGSAAPACAHCGEELAELRLTPGTAQVSSLVQLVVDTFSCPSCGKILSVSGRK